MPEEASTVPIATIDSIATIASIVYTDPIARLMQ